MQTIGQGDILQALVEVKAKSQALQTARPSDILQALVETMAKSQALQTAGPSDVLQALVKKIAKSQALQTVGQSDVLHSLVELTVKSQVFNSVNLGNSFQYNFFVFHWLFSNFNQKISMKVFPSGWQINPCVDIAQCNFSLKTLLFEAVSQ